MSEKKSKLIPAQHTRPPFVFRLVDIVLDIILPHIRFVLFPFRLLTGLWNGVVMVIWMLSNEYTKGKFGHCGTGVRIHGRFHVTAPQNLYVGDNVHINTNTFFRAEGELHIGNNTHISRNLVVYTMNHNYMGEHLPYDAGKVLKPVRIGRNVWIGMNVTVIPGVTIGDGAIIGMGAIIAKDVPPMAVVGTVPQRILKTRDQVHYDALDKAQRYSGMSGYPWKGKGKGKN